MPIHIQRAIEILNQKILLLGTRVEENVRLAVNAIEQRDSAMAARAIDNDDEIDNMEVDVEEECLKMLALYQPVATDLRLIVAALKINNDLERMADQAVNIAERALRLRDRSTPGMRVGMHNLAERAMDMVRKSLDALVELDKGKALEVCRSDKEVDDLYRTLCESIEAQIRDNPKDLGPGMDMVAVLKNLERCADLATNIAEDVVYTVDGNIIRHPSLARRTNP